MARNASAWMPIYWDSYLAKTSRLTTLEHGAYLLLIADYWRHGKPLPDDDAVLAKIAGLTMNAWKKIKATLAGFFLIADGVWRHERVEQELAEADQRYQRRASAGRAGGVAKAQQQASNAKAMPEQSHTQEQGTEDRVPITLNPERFIEGVSQVLKGKSQWTPEQRKIAWQTKVCNEAQRTMTEADYVAWQVAYLENQPWAKRKAEEINSSMRSRERGVA